METLELTKSRYTIKSNLQHTSTDTAVAKFIKFLQRVGYAQTKIQQGRFELALQCQMPNAYRNLYQHIGNNSTCKLGYQYNQYGIKIEQFVQLCLLYNTIPYIKQGNQIFTSILTNYFEIEQHQRINYNKFVQILKPRYKQVNIICNKQKQNRNSRFGTFTRNNKSYSSLYDLHRYNNNKNITNYKQINKNNFIQKFVIFISIIINEYFIIDRLKQQLSVYLQDLTIYLHKKYQLISSNMVPAQTGTGTSPKQYYLFIDKNKIKQFMNDHQMYNRLTYAKICNYLFGTDTSIQSIYLQLKKNRCGLDRQFSFQIHDNIISRNNSSNKENKVTNNHNHTHVHAHAHSYSYNGNNRQDNNGISKYQLQSIYHRINQLQSKINKNTKHATNIYQQLIQISPPKTNKSTIQTQYRLLNNKIDKQLSKIQKRKQINRSFKLANQRDAQRRHKTDYHNNIMYVDQWNKYKYLTKAQSQAALKIQSIQKRAMRKFIQNRHDNKYQLSTPIIQVPSSSSPYQNHYSVEQALEILDPKDNSAVFKKAGKIRTQY